MIAKEMEHRAFASGFDGVHEISALAADMEVNAWAKATLVSINPVWACRRSRDRPEGKARK